MNDQVELQIEGMHCDHCEITVGEALNRAGMTEVSVDWRRGIASGIPGAEFNLESASDEVVAIGYQVVPETEGDTAPGILMVSTTW